MCSVANQVWAYDMHLSCVARIHYPHAMHTQIFEVGRMC